MRNSVLVTEFNRADFLKNSQRLQRGCISFCFYNNSYDSPIQFMESFLFHLYITLGTPSIFSEYYHLLKLG